MKLCEKAVFHVDIDMYRHKELEIRMFDPQLVYQTFDSTSLVDILQVDIDSKSNIGQLNERLSKMKPFRSMKAFREACLDPRTKQPISHILDEPMLILGPKGPIITVERHMIFIGTSFIAAAVLAHYRAVVSFINVICFIFIKVVNFSFPQ